MLATNFRICKDIQKMDAMKEIASNLPTTNLTISINHWLKFQENSVDFPLHQG